MLLNVTRIDPTLPLPEYKTSGSVAFDLYTRVDTTIAPKTVAIIPTNFIFQIPQGYFLLVASRSSNAVKKGLTSANGIGIIDQDFCGPNDELNAILYNFTEQPVTLSRGDRMAQAMVIPFEKCEIKESVLATSVSRGGIGSTGR